jgi:iron-sulfur cluster assembly protein
VASVLTLTPTAAEAVRRLVESAPEDTAEGLRISPGPTTPEGTALQLEVVDGPETSDQQIAEGGATVYLQNDVATFLDDKVLDAEFEESGLRFAIRDQTEGFQPGGVDGRPG